MKDDDEEEKLFNKSIVQYWSFFSFDFVFSSLFSVSFSRDSSFGHRSDLIDVFDALESSNWCRKDLKQSKTKEFFNEKMFDLCSIKRLFLGQNVNGIRSKSRWKRRRSVGVNGTHGTVVWSDSTSKSFDSIGSKSRRNFPSDSVESFVVGW